MLVDYVAPPCLFDIMFMHFIMAQHICIQVNQIKLNLNNCWLSHRAAESMLTSATTLTGMGRS